MLAESHVAELISAYETGHIQEQQQNPQIREGVPSHPFREDIVTVKPLTIGGKTVKQPLKGLNKAQKDFFSVLQHPFISPALSSLEQVTGLNQLVLVATFLIVVSFYLLMGPGAQFLSNLIGFAYPAYSSFKAIRTKEKDDDTRWLIYWCAFTAFYMVDSLLMTWVSPFPVYWVAKTGFLVFLWLPQTQGALMLYALLVDPAVSLFDDSVNKYFH